MRGVGAGGVLAQPVASKEPPVMPRARKRILRFMGWLPVN